MSSISLQTPLNFQQLLDVVKKLTPAEKMKLNEAIWDENMAIPEEHKTLVLKRIKNAKDNRKV
jgi:hypothetical protein